MKPPWYEEKKWNLTPFPKFYRSDKNALTLNFRKMDLAYDECEKLDRNFFSPIFPEPKEDEKEKDKTGKSKKDKSKTVTKTKGFSLNFTPIQKAVIKKWGEEDTLVFNECVDFYNEFLEKSQNGETIMFKGKVVTSFAFENFVKLKMIIFDRLYSSGVKKGAPYDVLSGSVKTFCANLESAKTNFSLGNSTHFVMKKREDVTSFSLYIEKVHSTRGDTGFYPTLLGKIKNYDQVLTKMKKLGEINDSLLVFDLKQNRGFLKVVYSNEIQPEPLPSIKRDIVAIDPGLRHPICFYSLREVGYVGSGFKARVLKIQKNIRQMQSGLAKNKNKKGKRLDRKGRANLQRKVKSQFDKIKNQSKELRGFAGKFLTENYDTVLFPKFNVSTMISTATREEKEKKRTEFLEKKKGLSFDEKKKLCKKSVLRRRDKFLASAISPYKLKIHIKNKCLENGSTFIEVEEDYTSQCCGKCGELSKVYVHREKHCQNEKCKARIDRDVNAARNIFLKNVSCTGNTRKTKGSKPTVSVKPKA